MSATYYFYDLETSGLNPRDDRIMQFAGQRTDMELRPIGEPHNLLIALSDDTLPSPQALMVTGISPQRTVYEGYTEAQFARIFTNEIATEDTCIVGFNNIRFDDEFIRALLWRNYYDPYEWAYADGRSRWDMLDVARMTRALRPEGIEWPVVDGKPVNKLELLARANQLEHTQAHDAMSDVEALIGLAKLISSAQPQLYKYLLEIRDKTSVKKLVNLDSQTPFVYTSGRYDAAYQKTTVALPVAEAEHGNVYVYDLRSDPEQWVDLSRQAIADIIKTPYLERGDDYRPLPIKKLQYNRAPAVAPLGVLETNGGWQAIGLDIEIVKARRQTLLANPEFIQAVVDALADKPDYKPLPDAESKLYDGFIDNRDALRAEAVRSATKDDIASLDPKFNDPILAEMYPRYKARNYPRVLSDTERNAYEDYRRQRIARQTPKFMKGLELAARTDGTSDQQQFIIEELRLWYQSIVPTDHEQ